MDYCVCDMDIIYVARWWSRINEWPLPTDKVAEIERIVPGFCIQCGKTNQDFSVRKNKKKKNFVVVECHLSLQSVICCILYFQIMHLFIAGVFVQELQTASFKAISVFILAFELITFPVFFLLCGPWSNGSAKNLSSKRLMYDNCELCNQLTQPFFCLH